MAPRSIKHSQRFLPYLATLVALSLLPLLLSCSQEQPPPPREVIRPVKLLKIVTDNEIVQRSYPGRVRAAKRVDLSFQVGGPLIEMLVDEGQEVKQGQILARIDPRNFETNLRNAEGQLAKAQAALRSAESEYDRILRIRKSDPGAASESMLVKRKEAVDTITADIHSLSASVESAKNSLSDTYLKASFDGIVSKRYVDNFQEVRPQESIVSLDQLGKIEIIVDIPETLMARLKTNRQVNIIAEFAAAPGKQFELTAKEFSTRADVTTQTYQIVLEMERPADLNILPGMTATVRGSTPAASGTVDSFIIPAYAIFASDSGKAQVWVVNEKEMTVHSRPVTTGSLVGQDGITITEGLQTGEVIAVTGVTMLKEGMKIRDLAKVEGYGK
ncbi:efflux RND transporter periplasmic adaptor subunit [Desulfopila aestuarii]|uniref:RND family efflux transporter, MFP subunit n=1 Tax=Desulfopila aestuarii DSM 18488 TaxID=1121416 RepID=A0A1M7YCP2_9BACT|nr:efflux RND transporter periplasmic adaptor subunit [Desulfopila aestuarii]SHO50373.1 RND family efflux transporter, MFP subunit [Desulfopila aestuarii DSM 18488]